MLSEILNDLEARLKAIFPDVFASLLPPATADQLLELASAVGVESLPDDMVELLSWHNGQSDHCSLNQEDSFSLLSTDGIEEAMQFIRSLDPESISPWCESWLPLLYNGSGDYQIHELKTGRENRDRPRFISVSLRYRLTRP